MFPTDSRDPATETSASVLDVLGLRVAVSAKDRETTLVNGISFGLRKGEVLGIRGECCFCKTMLARSILQILPPGVRAVGGEVRFHGRDLLRLPEAEMRRIRGRHISYVFQDSMAALSPLLSIGYQLREAIRVHGGHQTKSVDTLLDEVGIIDPARRQHDYPHQFSGGMCQGAMIAIALANNPTVLLADEPTSALDVTVQLQILDLLSAITRQRGMSTLLITH